MSRSSLEYSARLCANDHCRTLDGSDVSYRSRSAYRLINRGGGIAPSRPCSRFVKRRSQSE